MTEMQNLEATFVNKPFEEPLPQPDDPTDNENLTFNNVYSNENRVESKEKKPNSKIEDLKTLSKNTIILNQEIYKNSNITNYVVNNNHHSYEIPTRSRYNDTWSYQDEFDLFLKKYKENYDNYSSSATKGSTIPTDSETQQFRHDYDNDNKYEHIKHFQSSFSSCGNSENYLPRRNSSEPVMALGNIYTKDSCNFGDMESSVALTAEITKELDLLNTENVLNYDDKVKHYTDEFLDDFNLAVKRDITTVEEKDNIISVTCNRDSLANCSLSPLGTMEIDLLDKFEADTDCEGYHSSDFEFIDETEATLGGIINKSWSDIMYKNFTDDTFEAIEDGKVNFDEPGPSCLGYDRLESNSPRFNSSIDDSSVEELINNHVIPEGEQLYELFAEPWAVFNYEAENKAFYSNKAMHFDVDNIGFNIGMLQQRHEENEIDDVVKQEAVDSAKKILTIYPVANANRRRRRF